MKPTLVSQLEQKIADRERRCRPACERANWVDGKLTRGLILTVCGACGTFIGYRPVGGKSGKELSPAETIAPYEIEVEA